MEITITGDCGLADFFEGPGCDLWCVKELSWNELLSQSESILTMRNLSLDQARAVKESTLEPCSSVKPIKLNLFFRPGLSSLSLGSFHL